jgi:hypothetical protein
VLIALDQAEFDRVNFLMDERIGVPVLSLLESFLQCRLRPRLRRLQEPAVMIGRRGLIAAAGRRSLREVATELAGYGYVTPSGKHYSASAVASMLA